MATKEKFEEAKRRYETANADQRYVLESLFPELKESEDERIRKGIIRNLEYLADRAEGFVKDELKERIAWLEKQAQKAWTEEDKNMLKWVTGYLENKMLNAPMGEERTACKNAIAWFKDIKDRVQPQQKQEWSESDKERIEELVVLIRHSNYTDGVKRKVISWLDSLKDRVQTQPKQEWSEEDEEHIKSLLERLEGMCKKGATFIRTGFAVSEDEDWLKHLKDRVLQPKQEWSEEDKRKIDRIYYILRQAADTHAFSTSCRLIGDKECIELQDFLKSLRPQSKQVLRDTFGYEDGRQFGKNEVLGNPEKYRLQRFAEWSKSDKEIVKEIDIIIHGTNSISDEVRKKLQDWLKSLRPQSHWKTSDEQIDALLKLEEMHVLEHKKNQENAHLYMVVKSIREQLLKLREE